MGMPDPQGAEPGALRRFLRLSHVIPSSSMSQRPQEALQIEGQPPQAQLRAEHRLSSRPVLVVTLLWLRSPQGEAWEVVGLGPKTSPKVLNTDSH